MQAHIYGIKNCDTMKKALRWLDERHISYEFHDYKKTGTDKAILQQAFAQHGWENVLNKKGTTWRALPENLKTTMNETQAQKAALENPSLIRRPLLVLGEKIYLGFDEKLYAGIFKEL